MNMLVVLRSEKEQIWKDGKVTRYRITSPEACQVNVCVNGEAKTIRSEGI